MKKTKLILLLCMAAIFAVAVALLAGCNVGGIEYNYDYLITFDYNVDHLGVATNCENQYLGVNDGGKIIAPTKDDNNFKEYTIANFYNKGWFTAKTDSDGNPVRDADGKIVLDKQWNFETDVVKGAMTLYADFHRNPTLTVKVAGGTDLVVSRLPGERYNRPMSDSNKPQLEGHTFIDYYKDSEFTEKFQFPYVFAEDKDDVCYAKMFPGKWTVVENVTAFRNALRYNENMYLNVADGELDFVKNPFTYLDPQLVQANVDYTGKIYGNGCVLKNITVNATYKNGKNTYSLFGNLGENAEITDLTFENLTLNMEGLEYVTTTDSEALQSISVALFANSIPATAILKNLTFTNCTLDYGMGIKPDIPNYGYYSSLSQDANYDFFDLTKLTIKRNGQTVTLN